MNIITDPAIRDPLFTQLGEDSVRFIIVNKEMYEYAKENYNAIFKSMGGQTRVNIQKGYEYPRVTYRVYMLGDLPCGFLGQDMAIGCVEGCIVEKYDGYYRKDAKGDLIGNGAVVLYDTFGVYSGWGEWRDFISVADSARRVCFLRDD